MCLLFVLWTRLPKWGSKEVFVCVCEYVCVCLCVYVVCHEQETYRMLLGRVSVVGALHSIAYHFSRASFYCLSWMIDDYVKNKSYHNVTHCNALQHTATHCNALQRTATHMSTHTATHTAAHAATHAATHTATNSRGGATFGRNSDDRRLQNKNRTSHVNK